MENNSQQQDGEREEEYICSLNSSSWRLVQLLPQIELQSKSHKVTEIVFYLSNAGADPVLLIQNL